MDWCCAGKKPATSQSMACSFSHNNSVGSAMSNGGSMQVGDLVRDTQFNDVGIIVEIDIAARPLGVETIYKILFPKGIEWLTNAYIEVLNESR